MSTKPRGRDVALDRIVATGETQPRVLVDLIIAKDYREKMDAGSVFPAIDVFDDGEQLWLADGFHRVYAARQAPAKKTIAAFVHHGDKRAAILFAVAANVTHGRPRTNEDKRHAVLMLLTDAKWGKRADQWIANTCKVSNDFVKKTRSSLSTEESEKKTRLYTNRYGTVAEMDTTRIGKSARLVPDLLEVLHDSVLRDDPQAVARLVGMDAEKQQQIAEAAAAHPEDRKIQTIWSRVNQQENQRRIDNLPERGDRWTIHHCAALDLIDRLPPKSVDVIITDPPYPEQYASVYEDLSHLAAHVLRDGGLCVAMTGKTHLPTYMIGLGTALTYHWLVPIIMTQNARVWDRRVFTRWKPLLIYSKGTYDGLTFHDVIHSEDKPSDHADHIWQQGDLVMKQIVERFSVSASVVLDPFVGSGTTGVAAITLDRVFIGADIDEQAALTARRRLDEAVQSTSTAIGAS